MRTILALMAAGLMLTATPSLAASAPDWNSVKGQGMEAVLKLCDARDTSPTAKWTFKMTIQPKGGTARHLKFSVWQKDFTKRLTRFLEPGELKGMSILARGANVMYVYSPQTDGVRRVAAHAKKQPLLGSDATYDDMVVVAYNDHFTAKLDSEDATHAWLALSKKADADTGWERVRLRVDKKLMRYDRIEYFEDGKKVKEQLRDKAEVFGGGFAFRKVTLHNVTTGHKTVLYMETQEVLDDIPESAFKKRNLVRGN